MRSLTARSSRLAVLLALVVLASACRYTEVDGVGTRTTDAEHPPQLDVTLLGCAPADLGQWRADAVVTNGSDTTATYEIVVAFQDGDVRLSQRSHWIRNLRPGETAEIAPAWWVESPDRVTSCRLSTVNRFG